MPRKWLLAVRNQGLGAQWSASITCALVSLGLSIFLARLMGPAVFGTYTFWLGVGAAMGIAMDAGFRTLLLRERATATTAGQPSRPEQRLPAMLGHLLLAGPALGLLSWAASGEWSGAAVALCFVAITLAQWYSAWLKGAGAFHREANWQLLGRFLSALLIVVALLLTEPGPAVVFCAWACGLLLAWLITRPPKSVSPALPRVSLYVGSLSFAAVDLATLIYHRVDIILLYSLADAAEVGRYAAAYRLYDGILLLAAPVTMLLFRRMRLAPEQHPENTAMVLALAAGILLATAGWLFGTPLTAYLFGAIFTHYNLIGWLFCALIFALPNGVLSQWAIARHQERYYALAATLAAVFNLALNTILIPQHGALGAAWATMATEALLGSLLFALWWGLRHRSHGLHP